MTLCLEEFRVLLLDMNSTFMFGEDRFGPHEDFFATYRELGGRALAPEDVERAIRSTFHHLEARYRDPRYEDDFLSLDEALVAVAHRLPAVERRLLGETFAHHELGVVSDSHAEALHALAATHELRLLSNIWAPKDAWIAELDRAGVLALFSRTIFSSDTRSVKPSLRLTLAALDRIECARHEVLMVGDSLERDVAAGRRAGIATAWIAVPGSLSPHGDGGPDYRITSLLDLPAPTS